MRELLSGVIAALALISALHFRKFAKQSADVFFDLFAAAFLLLAVNSAALGLVEPDSEGRVALYAIRLASFVIILGAIWHKNRA